MENFQKVFCELMKEHGDPVKELSEKIPCGLSLIYQWMRGVMKPSVKRLIKIADFFQCSLDYLAGRKTYDDHEIHLNQEMRFKENLSLLLSNSKDLEKRLRNTLHFSRSTIYDWRMGNRDPSLDNLALLAEFFGCTMDYLVGREF